MTTVEIGILLMLNSMLILYLHCVYSLKKCIFVVIDCAVSKLANFSVDFSCGEDNIY